MAHVPVLKDEVIKYLEPKPDENFIDATIGEGGHTGAILEKTRPQGKLLGIDLDKKTIEQAASKFKKEIGEERLILVCDNFINLEKIIKGKGLKAVQGILADLGLSSNELEESGRGFSFLRNEPLDMRFGEQDLTAQKIINKWPPEKIEEILKNFGQEQFTKSITKEIIVARKIKPIETAFELVAIIKRATPGWYHHKKIHPATKTFQALRIAVNDELENLKEFLIQAFGILEKGGRLAVISFHSLEDRIVKNFFKEKTKQNLATILTKKVITPGLAERVGNPRSRSAKLRVLVKNT